MNGNISRWNDAQGLGTVTGEDGLQRPFKRRGCSDALQSALTDLSIPPDEAVPVTFEVVAGQAVSLDLAEAAEQVQ